MPTQIGPDSPSPRAQTIGQLPNASQNVLNIALAVVGQYHYSWGGSAPPGFDCSGFVYWCFNQAGVSLARAMFSQLNQGEAVTLGPPGNRLANALPGDVVYFGLANTDPSRNHEGIIISTAGTGSMVNSACTSCGPQPEIDPIGEGSAGEPISAIRRFTSVNTPSGGTPGTPPTQLVSDTCCDIKAPILDVCIWRASWGRALLGGVFMAGAFALAIAGAYLIAQRAKLRIPAPLQGANNLVDRVGGHRLIGRHVYYGDLPEAASRGL